jgi:hypothetical protein
LDNVGAAFNAVEIGQVKIQKVNTRGAEIQQVASCRFAFALAATGHEHGRTLL